MTLFQSSSEYSTSSSSDIMSTTSTTNHKHNDNHQQQLKAKLIPSSIESITKAGERIRNGHLVSFPTETVYGLGCHALDPIAVQKVFEAKERPLTDPLIVHVNEANDALHLWDASSSTTETVTSSSEKNVLKALTSHFWPGPLTIVAKASPKVPSIIMANTGFVACRSPSHPIARMIIEQSQVPIAAPSANKFGHVSPTKASHVYDDLYMEDVWIVDPDLKNSNDDSDCGNHDNVVICDVGVESTVAKVEVSNDGMGYVSVLRHGAVSAQDILKCLQKVGLDGDFHVKSKHQATGDDVNNVAPGQTIKHYSPNVQSFIISYDRYNEINQSEDGMKSFLSREEVNNLENGVIIDFGGRLAFVKEAALAYRDLSPVGDSSVAAANVFDTLRWSETVNGAQRVYFPELVVEENIDDALILAVKDRLTRAASGVVVASFT